MGSRYQPDSDNICSGLTDSNGTPFPKRFRTRKRGNPRTVLCRHNPRIHYLPVHRAPVLFKEKTLRLVIIGIGLEMVAMSLLNTDLSIGISSVLLGLGLGLTMPEFLMIFVKLSHHCQRGTANTTHLLASEVGISLGIATACYMELDTDKMLHTGQMVASIALLFFVLVTYPYYIKKKVR